MRNRISQIMHHVGLTPAKFAEVINIQRSAMSHITTGRNNPSLDVVLKILEKYPFVDPEWLLYGKGEMIRKNKNTASTSVQQDLFSSTSPPQTPVVETVSTVAPKNRQEKRVEEPQNNMKHIIQEPVVIKKIESRNVSKIMIFYSDNTYETFIPEKMKKD
jgi:DNA-binding XRE family transcriptional regulator